jgi:hypothetical protein
MAGVYGIGETTLSSARSCFKLTEIGPIRWIKLAVVYIPSYCKLGWMNAEVAKRYTTCPWKRRVCSSHREVDASAKMCKN